MYLQDSQLIELVYCNKSQESHGFVKVIVA